MNWREAALWKKFGRRNPFNSIFYIHTFVFRASNLTRFYEDLWTVTQKVFSQVILFIDVLKFMQEKRGSLRDYAVPFVEHLQS